MSLIKRITGMLRRQRLDKDLDEELRSHLEMRAADNLAAGMSPAEARYEAQKRFGNTTLLKEDARNADIITWLDEAARDFRHALRMLQRSPGFHHRRRPHSCPRHWREYRDFLRHQFRSPSPSALSRSGRPGDGLGK